MFLCYHSGSMKPPRRLIPYLILNIFVSAIVAGAVIYYYNRTHPLVCLPTVPPVTSLSPGASDVNLDMVGIVGVGALNNEQVILQNKGTQEVTLTGWTLTDNKGAAYTFPQLTLNPGVQVRVHTTAGVDTPTDLYWDHAGAVWSSGELVALYDTNNIVRAFYRIP